MALKFNVPEKTLPKPEGLHHDPKTGVVSKLKSIEEATGLSFAKLAKQAGNVKAATIVEAELSQPQQVTKVAVEAHPMTETEALTQEYIVLFKQYEEHDVKNLTKRMEEIKKKLQTYANENMDADKPAVFTCADGELEFSERGKVTEIPQPLQLLDDLIDKFGEEVAASVISIGITKLRQVLSPLEMAKYAKENPGSRTLKSVRPEKA